MRSYTVISPTDPFRVLRRRLQKILHGGYGRATLATKLHCVYDYAK